MESHDFAWAAGFFDGEGWANRSHRGVASRINQAGLDGVPEVLTKFPQTVTLGGAWQAQPRTRLHLQTDWINWANAFDELPVSLTNGNNADINGLLATNGIKDSIPLKWRDQIVGRVGVERSLAEKAAVRFGYAHSNDPVPGSTLSPLTAWRRLSSLERKSSWFLSTLLSSTTSR